MSSSSTRGGVELLGGEGGENRMLGDLEIGAVMARTSIRRVRGNV